MSQITKPNTFTAQTKILSAQVNANFDTLYTQANAQDTSISTINTQIGNLSNVIVYPEQFGTVTAGVDSSSLFIQALAKGNRIKCTAGKTYSIGNPVTVASGQEIDLNGATIQLINNIDAAFVVNAPSTGNWVTGIKIHSGFFSGTGTSLVKVNGGFIAQSEISDLIETGTGGSIQKLIRVIADTKEPSKFRVRNITAQQYQVKFILSLESTQTGTNYSSFDGLEVENISMWCNINGGGIINAPANVMIHFSKIDKLYIGGQANNLIVINAYYFNLNTMSRVHAEFTGTNNTVINITNSATDNDYEQIIMYVSSEATSTGCLIFNGVGNLNRFHNYGYSPFDGVFGTYKLFNFLDGSFKNYLPNSANNRVTLNGQANHPISNYMSNPLITAAPQRVITATGYYPTYIFNKNEMGMGDSFKIEVWGHISGNAYDAISIVLDGDGTVTQFCTVGNTNMNGYAFKMELFVSFYVNESSVQSMGVYGLGIINGVAVSTQFKEFAYPSLSFYFKHYVSNLGAGDKFYLDGCIVTPNWKSLNS